MLGPSVYNGRFPHGDTRVVPDGRLLFVGDIHLGRRPRLDRELLARAGVRLDDLTPVAAWNAAVERALALRVDAVVLAGDVIDADEDRFEAFPFLQRGVQRLVDGGLAVLGIAGNHDGIALPRLAQLIPKFRLIGKGGTWERVTVPLRAGGRVALLGWSFPGRSFAEDPLDGAMPATGPEPVIGVLHADLDGVPGRSRYAPVSRARLAAVDTLGWFLGHEHAPTLVPGTRPLGYLGTLVGLDAAEHGPRGPWLVGVGAHGIATLEQVPLAPVRWEQVALDAGGIALPDAEGDALDVLFEHALGALRRAGEALAPTLGDARCVVADVLLTGRARARARLDSLAARLTAQAIVDSSAGVPFLVRTISNQTTAALDVDALAQGNDPAAVLARMMSLLRTGGPAADALLAEARRAVDAALPGSPSIDDVVRAALDAAGMDALDALTVAGSRA